jgi:flagellar biosynthesis protein FlhF
MSKLRTIQGKTLADALAEVRRQLGDEAVILHTRTVRRGGVLGVAARTFVEITAASTIQDLPPAVRKGMVTPRVSGREQMGPAEGAAERMVAVQRQRADAKDRQLADEVESVKTLVEELIDRIQLPPRKTDSACSAAGGQGPTSVYPWGAVGPPDESEGTPGHASTPTPDNDQITALYRNLVTNEVAEELAAGLVEDLRHKLSAAELADSERVRQALADQIAGLLPEGGEVALRNGPGPTVIALVGPTGVGKTTTLAKLAAHYAVDRQRSVGLITLDTRRIAAFEQLQTYAAVLGVPLVQVSASDRLRSAINAMRDCDLVLVDTAGCSPHDRAGLQGLRELLRQAAPDEVHLVLSATTSRSALERIVERFACLCPDCLIFTKLDEALGFGVIVSCLRKAGAKLSYFTTGQKVPGDIEVGAARRLAAGLLSGSRENTCCCMEQR